MDDNGQRDNGRHKDHYKTVHSQWAPPQHQIKDNQTMKLMAIMAERDAAIQERNLALSEKKAALAERDMAFLQRDAALAERNNAMLERASAIAALEHARENSMNDIRGIKHALHPNPMTESSYHQREIHISDAFPISMAPESAVKPRRNKRRKDATSHVQTKKASKANRKIKKGTEEDLNKQLVSPKQLEWGVPLPGDEDLNKQLTVTKQEWKDQDLGLNQVNFDESTMPVPVCSCTGAPQQCYKWGNGGWQSACCTTTLSMYPLPIMPNKRHARLGGRKMSGSAFTKLLSRLAAEGHDLSTPLDLKDHWAKHGTNRYITIR